MPEASRAPVVPKTYTYVLLQLDLGWMLQRYVNRLGVPEQRVLEHDGPEVVLRRLRSDKLLAIPTMCVSTPYFFLMLARYSLHSDLPTSYPCVQRFVSSLCAKAAARTHGQIILSHEHQGSTKATTRS